MKPKNCLIFGASGQIGRNLIRKLTKNNYKVTAVTRNTHRKGYILKTQANAGYIDVEEANIFDEARLVELIKKTDICINLIGILFESGKKNSFENIHSKFPYLISKICNANNVSQFIQLSALGVDKAVDCSYAKSKLNGEINIKQNFSKAVILRPSIVYSVDDNFTTKFMTLLSRLPFFPLYYNGGTKFTPIHCSDLVEVIYQVILRNINSTTIECIGTETISFKYILKKLLHLIKKKRLLIPLPLPIAKLSARFFQMFPSPLLTLDQLNLLKYDNVASGQYKTNFEIDIPSTRNFEQEIEKYCYMWREGGQFAERNIKK